MFCRTRKSNLSLERAVYKPAQKDTEGNIVTQPVRTTAYLGSVSKHARFSDVPAELLSKLDDNEKAELHEALKVNEPKPDVWLNSLPRHLGWGASELKDCARLINCPTERKALELRVKAVETEWYAFFRTAQELGLKRKVNRPKKVTGHSPDGTPTRGPD